MNLCKDAEKGAGPIAAFLSIFSRDCCFVAQRGSPKVCESELCEFKRLDWIWIGLDCVFFVMSLSAERVLVTGGSGYIGSHTVLQLLAAGATVTIVDNFCNSSPKVLPRLHELAGEENAKRLNFVEADLLDKEGLEKLLFQPAADAGEMFTSCIHFAGLKAVGESVAKPLLYYHNNITGTLFLLELMLKFGCNKIVFSSSATVYGSAESPLSEEGSTTGQGITNPYGQTKYMIECILRDFARANPSFGVVVLRYFNPVGAHASGRIGESPNGIPNNLMPYVQQVAVGKREKLTVFGDDYDTPDGTGVRDYIHVEDLAAGHLAALEKMTTDETGFYFYNLGRSLFGQSDRVRSNAHRPNVAVCRGLCRAQNN